MCYLYFIAMWVLWIGLVTSQCKSMWKDKPNYKVAAERVYYIACVEEEWDYCPEGNLLTGEDFEEGTWGATFCLGDGARNIGNKYIKGLWREFEDKCFEKQKKRSPREEHLGALGPNIRALTGEKIKVYYKNECSFPNSMHPHGLRYNKLSEGAPYADGSTEGDSIAPGDTWIYIWHARKTMVDEGSSSKMWIYHSHVDEPADVYTGLVGAIIITRKGKERSKSDLRPKDIDREFVTFMMLYEENLSLLFEKNLDEYLDLSLTDGAAASLISNEHFIESNKMHAINGFVFGNLQHLDMRVGEKVRWYTASFGNEGDGPHSPHWHGNIVQDAEGEWLDTVVLIPGTTKTVTMDCDAPGKWLYHCHVDDHVYGGMLTTYFVEECGGTTRMRN